MLILYQNEEGNSRLSECLMQQSSGIGIEKREKLLIAQDTIQ